MDHNLVLHIDSARDDVLRLLLRNAENYLAALPGEKFELAVVANGPGVTQFRGELGELGERAKALAAQGVKFRMCANALREKSVAPESLWPFCEIVPAGLVELVRLQKEGFAYVKP